MSESVHWETSKNLYTRTLQHMHNKKEDESFMDRHFQEDHGGEDRQFTAKVTHTNRDCLTRQIREGVLIRRTQKPLLNSRTEWFQPPLFRIQSEVVREQKAAESESFTNLIASAGALQREWFSKGHNICLKMSLQYSSFKNQFYQRTILLYIIYLFMKF